MKNKIGKVLLFFSHNQMFSPKPSLPPPLPPRAHLTYRDRNSEENDNSEISTITEAEQRRLAVSIHFSYSR